MDLSHGRSLWFHGMDCRGSFHTQYIIARILREHDAKITEWSSFLSIRALLDFLLIARVTHATLQQRQ